MFQYQRSGRFFAQIADEMAELGARELADLGAREVRPVYRGLHFSADKATLYRVNYMSRLASRIIAALATFPCRSTDELYGKAGAIDWSSFFPAGKTFAVFSNVSNSRITHSRFAALRLKDAIVDQLRRRTGRRPDVDTESPDLWVHIYIHSDRATVSVDTSGGGLHRRGYRKAAVAAPMRETLAAAIIGLTEWDGSRPLYDPMCGSGTLLTEALMRYGRIPPGYLRERFGFQSLPDFDAPTWAAVKRQADSEMRPPPQGLIGGSDASIKAVQAAGENLRALPFGKGVALKVTAFEKIKGIEGSVIVCNPPAGIRVGAQEGMGPFMKTFGDFLKQCCKGSTAYIYFNDRELIKHIGLRTSWKKPLTNGGLDGRLVRIDLY